MNAVIFPGQGAQYSGMGKSLYDNFSPAKETFTSIDNVLDFELSRKCFEADEAELKSTSIQQLAILAVSLAAFEVFLSRDIKVEYLAGLSLGEYSCLYAAGVISLEDVLTLVKERAMAMEQASLRNFSTMFAVMGLERKVLEDKAGQLNFYLANVNSPGQIVISLAQNTKENIRNNLKALGATVIELKVSGGFHSPFMNSAKEHLAAVAGKIEFADARIPIVSNVTARAHTKGEEIRDNLLEQLTSPVLWNDCMEFMLARGVGVFFEVGPSKVLKGLMRKINPEAKVVNIEKKEDLEGI